jgi:hypothetical protein
MEKTKISFYIPVEVNERIDRLAQKAEIDKTKLLVNLIDEGSKTLDACGKVGILQFAILMRNLSEKMEEWAKMVHKKKVEPL